MAAPLDNQNASKPESERASSFIHAAVTPGDKGLFMEAAKDWAKTNKVTDKRGVFTMWLLSVLHPAVPQRVHDLIKRRREQERKEQERISRQRQ